MFNCTFVILMGKKGHMRGIFLEMCVMCVVQVVTHCGQEISDETVGN